MTGSLKFSFRGFAGAVLLAYAGSQAAFSEEHAAHYTRAEMEQFLLTAKIVRMKSLGMGVTNSQRATLSDGKVEHDAHVQFIDETKASYTTTHGTELNFKDTYKFNIGAYLLDKMLELNMIPVSVERKVEGKSSAVTWWVDDKMFDEVDRKKQGIEPPDQDNWNKQMYVVRVFDQLIYNTDRNLGNLVIDKQWRMWMIDHTRAFRQMHKLLSEKDLVMCDRKLLANLKKLDQDTLNEELQRYVNKSEVKAMLVRRDLIIKFFEKKAAEKGEDAAYYDLPPRS